MQRARLIIAILMIAGFLVAGCIQPPGNNGVPPGSGNGTTTPPPGANGTGNGTMTPPPGGNGSGTGIPPGYEARDYCQLDGDCVRLEKCCDCGAGEYVNIYHQERPACSGPRCMCAVMDTIGKCQNNRCVPVPRVPIQPDNETRKPGFCGWSTNGTCATDSDCITGGCSGQVCQGISEPPVITTCIYSDCFDAKRFGLGCGCYGGSCKWG